MGKMWGRSSAETIQSVIDNSAIAANPDSVVVKGLDNKAATAAALVVAQMVVHGRASEPTPVQKPQ
jgi:hypothetical protein